MAFLFYKFENSIWEKLKETMSRKESKFDVIYFIYPQIIFLKRKF